MTYQQALDFLYSSLPMFQRLGKKAYKEDLTNIIKLCNALNNPQDDFKSIHIGGTNGKGTSAHLIASVLQEAGYKTGLFTSPHLKSFTERIKINGEEVEEAFVVDFIEQLQGIISELKPSFFEITVAMAFQYFSNKKVDIAVIEVGLGGRLDSTNIITPMVSLITNVSKDHTDLLGETIEDIAWEKAGIMKPGVPAVLGVSDPVLEPVFRKQARNVNCPLYLASGHYREFEERCPIKSSAIPYLMPGVVETFNQLKINKINLNNEIILKGIEHVIVNTGIKGRWQKIGEHPAIICDIAHNQEGVKLVVNQLIRTEFEQLFMVWGMVTDKQPDDIFKLLPDNALYFLVEPSIPRAMPVNQLAEYAKKYALNYQVEPDVNKAIAKAKSQAGPEDLIFVGGSTFVVAEVKEL